MAHLKVFKVKKREGVVERMSSQYEIIGKNMFKIANDILNKELIEKI